MPRPPRRPPIALALLLVVSTAIGCGGHPATTPDAAPEAFLQAMNRGKAQLENKDSRAAIAAYQEAVELEPGSAPAQRNLARAELLARDSAAALEALARAAEAGGESPATSYLTGLAHAREGRFGEAIPHFEQAVALDPEAATLRFQLANAYQAAGRHEAAVEQLLETVRLDPLHTSAHFKLAGFARGAGDRREYEARQREVARLRELYGEQNRGAEALETCVYTRPEPVPATPPALPPLAVRYALVKPEPSTAEALAAARAAAVLAVDSEGRASVALLDTEGGLSRLTWAEDGPRIVPLATVDLAVDDSGRAQLLVGDVYNFVPEGKPYDPERHAFADLLVVAGGGVRLLLGGADGFEDVTASSGLAEAAGERAAWIDVEQDGDLDLLLLGEGGTRLWQNAGDGSFRDGTAEAGLDGETPATDAPASDAAAADFDGDVALDLVVASEGGAEKGASHVWINQRTGRLERRGEPPGPWPAARRVRIDDLDGDGRLDTALLAAHGVVVIPGAGGARVRIDLGGVEARTLALVDPDNDGRLELAVGGAGAGEQTTSEQGAVRVFRRRGDGGYEEVGAELGLAQGLGSGPVVDLVAADLDRDGGEDLLLVTTAGAHLLLNEGGAERRRLTVRLAGTKTNPLGLGTRLEVRRGDQRIHRLVDRLPASLGVGTVERLDSVQVLWANGIVDNEVDVPLAEPAAMAVAPMRIVEKNVATGSCPFLYAWDGAGYRFVTDLLGNSPLGLSLRRGVPLDADPDELVEIGPAEGFPAEDGAYRLVVTEEMREVLYLDQARLVAVDHPAEVEVHPTDKLMPAPFPPSELVPLADLRPPVAVEASDGLDRLADLARIDGVFAPSAVPRPPPLRGQTAPLELSLDFGPLDSGRPLVLALTGWLQYGDASVNIALSQGAAEVIPPRLEAELSDGRRVPLPVVVGMPAGKTKTILVDLEGTLPRGARRLVLVTTFELRWDRIALGERLPAESVARHVVEPSRAELDFRGFSEIRSRAPGHPTTPDFATVSLRPPWRTALAGWMTRYGAVGELVAGRDGRLALVGAGDALELRFEAAALPAPPPGFERTFFFYSVGWDKDGDPNVIDGDTVEPLPVTAEDDGWRPRYNTRWVGEMAFAENPP